MLATTTPLPSLPLDGEDGERLVVLPSLPTPSHDFDEEDSLPPTQQESSMLLAPSAFDKEESFSSEEEEEDGEEEEQKDDEFADYPDSGQLNLISDEKLSKRQISQLRSWSFFICADPTDRSTWKLPYRDGKGRLNRPMLARARQVLTSASLVREMNIALDWNTRVTAMQCFARAWPGQPCKLVPAVNAPVAEAATPMLLVSTEDLLARGKQLMDGVGGGGKPQRRAAANAAEKQMQKAVLSDAAPNLLMKLSSRKRQIRSANGSKSVPAPTTSAPTPAPVAAAALPPLLGGQPRNKHLVNLHTRAKQKLALEREKKSKIGRAVEQEYKHVVASPSPPPPTAQEEEEEQDSDFVPEENESSEGEEEEEEMPEEPAAAATSQSLDAPAPTEPQVAEDEEEEEEEEDNARYRALLEADAERALDSGGKEDKYNRFVENQAEEEDDEEGGNKYRERVIGQEEEDEESEGEGDLRVTEEDLRGIVDVAKDDTALGRSQVLSLFQKQQEDADASLENKLSKDLKNHTLIASRKRLHASRLDRAMMEDDSGEETDEEQEMAKMLRIERESRAALDALHASAAAAAAINTEAMDEEEEEIRRELEQAQGFLKRSISLRRSISAASASRHSTVSLDSYASQLVEMDDDTRAVWESISQQPQHGAASSSAMEFGNSNSMLFRSDSSLQRTTGSLAKRAKQQHAFGNAGSSSSRGIATLSRGYVYTKATTTTLLAGEEEESAARSGFEQQINVPQSDAKARQHRRRAPLTSSTSSLASLPIARLLEPGKMQNGMQH